MNEHNEDTPTQTTVSEYPGTYLDFGRAYLDKGATQVSSAGKNISPNLNPGQLGLTQGVYNCTALAVPEKVMHSSPHKAKANTHQFLAELQAANIPITHILLVGGADTDQKEFQEIKTLLEKELGKKVNITIVKPQTDQESISIGTNPQTKTVHYKTIKYTKAN